MQTAQFVECLGLEARLLVPIHHIQLLADPVFPVQGLVGWPNNCRIISLDRDLSKQYAAAGLQPTQTALFARWLGPRLYVDKAHLPDSNVWHASAAEGRANASCQ